jgi:SAM-dependent methyltransferase
MTELSKSQEKATDGQTRISRDPNFLNPFFDPQYGVTYEAMNLCSGRPYTERARTLLERSPSISPSEILELGSGTGTATRVILDRFPNAHITAVDQSLALQNVARLVFDQLPEPDSTNLLAAFDSLTEFNNVAGISYGSELGRAIRDDINRYRSLGHQVVIDRRDASEVTRFGSNKFDTVIANEFMHWTRINRPPQYEQEVLTAVAKVVKPGGRLIFGFSAELYDRCESEQLESQPAFSPLREAFSDELAKALGKRHAPEPVLWKRYSLADISETLAPHGFRLESSSITPLHFSGPQTVAHIAGASHMYFVNEGNRLPLEERTRIVRSCLNRAIDRFPTIDGHKPILDFLENFPGVNFCAVRD